MKAAALESYPNPGSGEFVTHHVLDALAEGVLIADLQSEDARLSYVNRAFTDITGYSFQEALGKNCRYLQGNDRLQPEVAIMRQAIESREAVHVVLRNYRKDGALFWNDLRLAPVFDNKGIATHYVGLMSDVTKLKDVSMELDRIAFHDGLSGVVNRDGFCRGLEQRLEAPNSTSQVVAKIDVVSFHEINSSFGYDVGDALLKEIATRLQTLPGALVGRTGSNEFVVAAPAATSETAESIMGELGRQLGPRFALPGATVGVRFAIGFTVSREGDGVAAAMREASVAMHASKSSYLHAICRFDSAMDVKLKARVRLTGELQQALANSEFVMQYQPKVDIDTGAVVGAEALMRWRHPVFGVQAPSRFIAAAEETGLILELGHWGLSAVADFARRLNVGRERPLNLAVNVSRIQFAHADMPALLRSVVRQSGVDPAWLTIELTESTLADNQKGIVSALRDIRSMGFGLAIDDFGTGYSSLRYLQDFPVSEIKLDRGFISGLQHSGFNRTVVESVVKIGREMGASVTAEGIETQAEHDILKTLGCPFGQGFLFGEPMDAEAFAA